MDKIKKKHFQPSSWGRSTTPTSRPDIPPPPSGRNSSAATYPSSSANQHPYSNPRDDMQAIVSNSNSGDDEQNCPVCLESLSFSFKLPGEKPHIVPECNHALHEACFTAVYGPVVKGAPRQTSLGLCGVCRRPMKLNDGDSGKGNKLASLTGMGGANTNVVFPGRLGQSGRANRLDQSTPTPYDPTEDDPLDHSGSVKSGSSDPSQYIVTPAIQVRPEFASIARSASAPTQPLTCIVVVELPSRRPQQPYQPTLAQSPSYSSQNDSNYASPSGSQYYPTPLPDAIPEEPEPSYSKYPNGDDSASDAGRPESASSQPFSYNATPSATDGPFASVVADLKSRMYDWKGHELSGMGPLLMFDILGVRRESTVREFIVYLFREAILCVLEEKKKSLGRLLHSSGSSSGYGDTLNGNSQKGVLRLKGRIYVRHIKRVIDTSVAGELSLTIDMEDERLDSFILTFKNRSSLESWRTAIIGLVTMFHDAVGRPRAQTPSGIYGSPSNNTGEMEEFGINSKAARILSIGSGETSGSSSRITSHDSMVGSSHRSTMSSTTTNSRAGMSKYAASGISDREQQMHHQQQQAPPQNNGSGGAIYHQTPPSTVNARSANGASNSLTPVLHTPLDLICVISVPPPSAHVSTASLKTRVIKTSLEFIIGSMGARDRLSIVTFEVGVQGRIRKTPFLSMGRTQSRQRLANFVDTLSERRDNDEFFVQTGRDEKTDVVTAVNHGLDVVLQRKHKNPISGLILVSDAADSTRRAQMDLVLARAEAANIPIHSFGYGKSHDPASLWLMSNHTSGTYTFVRDWYDLRDCLAGCVGGMMSIALTNVKLHMRVVDGMRFKMRKVSGAPHAIVSADGHDVHVDIGELRYGEKKEMLVELELDNASDQSQNGVLSGHGGDMGHSSATDQFVRNLGALNLGGSTANLVDGIMDRMIDEVPVFELDGSFYDPAVARTASRLANPVLLTVTLIPAQSPHRPPSSSSVSDVVIVRRRMELLASDMITRALVLIARKNYNQAQKIIEETKRILQTVLQNVSQGVSPVTGGSARSRKELLSLAAVRTLQSMLQDLQTLIDALEDNVDLFQHDHRNFGAQQAMILRDQKSWTGRTPTEKLFWVADNSLELVSRSHDWVSNVSRE